MASHATSTQHRAGPCALPAVARTVIRDGLTAEVAKYEFNGDVSNWNTAKVTDMSERELPQSPPVCHGAPPHGL